LIYRDINIYIALFPCFEQDMVNLLLA